MLTKLRPDKKFCFTMNYMEYREWLQCDLELDLKNEW